MRLMMSHEKIKTSQNLFERIVSELCGVRLTAILLTLLIPATIVGTLIPQNRPLGEYVALYSWEGYRALRSIGLTNLFKSAWYVGLLLILGLNILACTALSLKQKKRGLGFIVVHLSLLLLIAGGLLSAKGRIRGQVMVEEGQAVDSFVYKDKEIPLGFQIRLKDFELQRYEEQGEKLTVHIPALGKDEEFLFQKNTWTEIPGTAYRFRVEHGVPDFRIDSKSKRVFSASNEPNNPAILVHIEGEGMDYSEWVFYRFQNIHTGHDAPLFLKYTWAPFYPKDFISHLEVLQDGQVIEEKSIEVNHPLRFGGWSIYQSSYDQGDERWSGLEIVRDPGVPYIYSGILLLMIGLSYNIYIKPWILKRPKLIQEKIYE